MQTAPETFTIECNRSIANLQYPDLNPSNDEWVTLLNPPLQLKKNDQITISNIFLNERGAASDVISFNTDELSQSQDSKTRIIFSFYAMNDSTSDKRNGLDIVNESSTEYYKNVNTYAFTPLYRRQYNSIFVNHSDTLLPQFSPYNNLFFPGIPFNQSPENIQKNYQILCAAEDRYIPGVYYNNLKLSSLEGSSYDPLNEEDPNKVYVYFKAYTEELVFASVRDRNNNPFGRTCQPGTISYIRTPIVAAQNTASIYFDNYYLCTNVYDLFDIITGTFGWAFDANSNGSNIYSSSTTQIIALSGQKQITFPNDPIFDNQVYTGMYISIGTEFGAGQGYLEANELIVSVSNATPVVVAEIVIYNNTSILGKNTIRVSDVTTLQEHMILSTDIPTGSRIISTEIDSFIDIPKLPITTPTLSGTNKFVVPPFMELEESVNMVVRDITPSKTNLINQNMNIGATSLSLNPRKWLTKHTDIDSSAQQDLGVDNSGYFSLGNTNNLFVGQNMTYQFISPGSKIKEIIPFVAVPAFTSYIYGGEKQGNSYVDVETKGITLLHTNDNEPNLYNITSGTVTSRAFAGTANITHISAIGSSIRVFLDINVATPVSAGTNTAAVLQPLGEQSSSRIIIYGSAKVWHNYVHSYIWDSNPATNHFNYGTEIILVVDSQDHPGYIIVHLSQNLINPLLNGTSDIASIGFVNEVEITQSNSTSSYIIPDIPLIQGITSGEKIEFYTNEYDENKNVFVGQQLINAGFAADTRILTVTNQTDGSNRQLLTIDKATIGTFYEFEEITTQQRAFGNNDFYVNSVNVEENEIILSNNVPYYFDSDTILSISKYYPNQGTVTMDNNFTSDIPQGTVINFSLTDRIVTITNNIRVDIPQNQKCHFTIIPTDLVASSVNQTLVYNRSPKGFQYGSPTDLGMKENEGVNINDNLYTSVFAARGAATNTYENNFLYINDYVNDKVTLQIESFTNTITENLGKTYNENSILTGSIENEISSDSTSALYDTITINMPPGFVPSITSQLFNFQRGFVMKLYNYLTKEEEYIRLENGINNPKVTFATYTAVTPSRYTFTKVLRGQYGTNINGFLPNQTIVTFFNPITQKNAVVAKIGKVYNINDEFETYQKSADGLGIVYGFTNIMSKQTNTEFLEQVKSLNNSFHPQNTHTKAINLFSGLENTYQIFYNYIETSDNILHRSYIDIDIGVQTNLSPSDIAERFNEIAQTPTDYRSNFSTRGDTEGLIIEGSKNMGFPSNATFMPICGLNVTPLNNSENNTYPGFTEEDIKVAGGSHFFKCRYSNFETTGNFPTPLEKVLPIMPRNGKWPAKYAHAVTGNTPLLQFPKTVIDDGNLSCKFSQMVGCSDFSLNYNTSLSRFELKTHQIYSTYSSKGGSGELATKMFHPYIKQYYSNVIANKPTGQKYQDRWGGINFECWSAPIIEFGLNDPLSIISDPYIIEDPNNLNQVGRRFWSKLGFTDTQLMTQKGISIVDGLDVMNGSSGNKVDVSFSYVPGEISANSLPSPQVSVGTSDYKNYSSQSINGLELGSYLSDTSENPIETFFQIDNYGVAYNLPSTIGIPFDNNFVALVPAVSPSVKPTPSTGDPNPDNVINPGYNISFSGAITGMTAELLPSKTSNPYFLLFCKEFAGNNNFYTTFNKGSLQGQAMATISRLYSSMDFYYSYQSPQAFYLKNDITISTITNKILNSDMTTPNTIGGNSCVVYQIIRQNPVPIPLAPTITEQQDEFFEQQAQLQLTASKMQQSNGLSGVQSVINQITQAIIHPSEDESELINKILGNAVNLNISKMSPSQLKQEIATNPNMADILNDIQTLQGITPEFGTPPDTPQLSVSDSFQTPSSIFGSAVSSLGPTPDNQEVDFTLDPEELTRALNQAQMEEATMSGAVDSVTQRVGQGRPKTIDFVPRAAQVTELTPTAELSQREQILREGGSVIVGQGRKKLSNAQLHLAQKISNKSADLRGVPRTEQKIANYPTPQSVRGEQQPEVVQPKGGGAKP